MGDPGFYNASISFGECYSETLTVDINDLLPKHGAYCKQSLIGLSGQCLSWMCRCIDAGPLMDAVDKLDEFHLLMTDLLISFFALLGIWVCVCCKTKTEKL